jgi:hypothetical protein
VARRRVSRLHPTSAIQPSSIDYARLAAAMQPTVQVFIGIEEVTDGARIVAPQKIDERIRHEDGKIAMGGRW